MRTYGKQGDSEAMPGKRPYGQSTKKCTETPQYCPDVTGTQGIRFKLVSIQDNEEDEGFRECITPIDPTETEESLVGALWVREMLAGIEDKRTRWIVEMRVVHDLTFREIGEMLCLSRERVYNILHGGTNHVGEGILKKLRAKARA
jgi:DNA-directed RNA polymerase specialized sigma24 family protein